MILNFKNTSGGRDPSKGGMVGALLGFKVCLHAVLLQCASSSHFMLAVQELNITETRSQLFIFHIEPISSCSMFRDHLDQRNRSELSGQLSVEFYDSYKEGGGPVVLRRQ